MREQKHWVFPDELFYVILCISEQDILCHLIYKTSRLLHGVKQLKGQDFIACVNIITSFLGRHQMKGTAEDLGKEWQDYFGDDLIWSGEQSHNALIEAQYNA